MKLRVVLFLVAAPLFGHVLGAQQAAPPAKVAAPAKRRTLEIRGQAPAPEVVTVRPREIPQYTRRIIVPLTFDSSTAGGAAAPAIILPATVLVVPAAPAPAASKP